MGKRRIVWGKVALRAYYDQALWYRTNKGEQFVQSFVRNIQETIDSIAAMPTIGIPAPPKSKKQYRSFPSHPKCRIYYWYDEKELHITGLRFMSMQ